MKNEAKLSVSASNQIIDPFQSSLNSLLVVAFPKTNSKNYVFAVSIAEGAERYGVAVIGGKTMHVAVFGMTQADAGRATALLGYIRGWKGAFIFARGSVIHDSYRIEEVLKCFLQSCRCRDKKAHCHFIIDNPFVEDDWMMATAYAGSGDKYIFPCKDLVTSFHFQRDHPSSIEDQIQAAGVEFGNSLCPNFAPDEFRKVEPSRRKY